MISDILLNDERISLYPETSTGNELWINTNPLFSQILFRANSVLAYGFTKILNASFKTISLLSKILPGSSFAIAIKDKQNNDYLVKRFYKTDPIIEIKTQIYSPEAIEYDEINKKLNITFKNDYNNLTAFIYLSFSNPLINSNSVNMELDILPQDFSCIGTSIIRNGHCSINLELNASCLCAVGVIKQIEG